MRLPIGCLARNSYTIGIKRYLLKHTTRMSSQNLENQALHHHGLHQSVVLIVLPLLFSPSLKGMEANCGHFLILTQHSIHFRTLQLNKNHRTDWPTAHTRDHYHLFRRRAEGISSITGALQLNTLRAHPRLIRTVLLNCHSDFHHLPMFCDNKKVGVQAAGPFFRSLMSQHILRLIR